MDNVIFLDFDGPLFTERAIFYDKWTTPHPQFRYNIPYWKMDAFSVEFLNHVYSTTPFYTVVSSSWRNLIDDDERCKEFIEELFYVNGLKLPLHNTDFRTSPTIGSRFAAISDWIERHNPSDYLIIDDRESGPELDILADPSRLIMTNCETGFTNLNCVMTLNVTSKWGKK